MRVFPGGPVVKNPPCNAGDARSIPGGWTKIPHAVEQRSLGTPTKLQGSQVNKYLGKKFLSGYQYIFWKVTLVRENVLYQQL